MGIIIDNINQPKGESEGNMKILAEQYEQALSVQIGDDREASYCINKFMVKKFDKDNKICDFISFEKDEFKALILWGVQMLEEVK